MSRFVMGSLRSKFFTMIELRATHRCENRPFSNRGARSSSRANSRGARTREKCVTEFRLYDQRGRKKGEGRIGLERETRKSIKVNRTLSLK